MLDLSNPILKAAIKSIVGKIDFTVDRKNQLIVIQSPVEKTITYDDFFISIEELLNE